MALFVLDKDINPIGFPPVENAEPDGLLAIGGDLSTDRLLLAYQSGIFPWYSEGPILWWCPDPRFVLIPAEMKIKSSVEKSIASGHFRFSTNTAFQEVIRHCKMIRRPGQAGTWITDEVERAYLTLHQQGWAHSAELWEEEKLIGGLYGIRMGKVFFGESMFSLQSNASRIAFTQYAQLLQKEGVELIDCQVYTEYLESFGAHMIPRTVFVTKIEGADLASVMVAQ